MVDSFGASAQTAKVAPEVMLTKIPSFCASSRLHRSVSGVGSRRRRRNRHAH
jgi:hypothetical protein